MLVDIIAGERSTFIKIAPLIEAIQNEQKKGTDIRFRFIYIGPHYDKSIGDQFFQQLGIPRPNINLEISDGSQAEETAIIMARYEKVILAARPDLVLVTGDSISAMACALAAKKIVGTQVAHIAAGIRVNDKNLPEEINRIVTDSIADYYFTTSHSANEHLRQAGVPEELIFFVGNTLIDTLLKQSPHFSPPPLWQKLQLLPQRYFLVCLQQPANVDMVTDLKALLISIIQSSQGFPVIFPVHPRAAKTLELIGIRAPNLFTTELLDYPNFHFLVKHAKAVITDSQSIQDETTVLQVPCMTLAPYTEHPETASLGTNEIIGTDHNTIVAAFARLYNNEWRKGHIPYLWDGKAAERILAVLKNFI